VKIGEKKRTCHINGLFDASECEVSMMINGEGAGHGAQMRKFFKPVVVY
jgi:hypothetical protein